MSFALISINMPSRISVITVGKNNFHNILNCLKTTFCEVSMNIRIKTWLVAIPTTTIEICLTLSWYKMIVIPLWFKFSTQCFTVCKYHTQMSLFSPSAVAQAIANIRLFPLILITNNSVPPRNVFKNPAPMHSIFLHLTNHPFSRPLKQTTNLSK